jgi:RHS repeat-associated protein
LKEVVTPSTTVHYVLDGFNRRVQKINGTTVQATYLYRDQNRIEGLLTSTGTLSERFVYGTKPNVPDYVVKSGTTYRIISDERGSVRFVINDGTGAIAQQITYDEFGNVLSDTSAGFQPFYFAGCLYDQDTKLCHFGAREYDPSTGRWLSKDPILFYGGDTNLYGYVVKDPVNHIDPSGLIFQNIISHFTTPGQQATLGAGLSLWGLLAANATLAAIKTAKTPWQWAGAGLLGAFSGFLGNEGYQNTSTGIQRILDQMTPADLNALLNPTMNSTQATACNK